MTSVLSSERANHIKPEPVIKIRFSPQEGLLDTKID
jgi:hypothetical protein